MVNNQAINFYSNESGTFYKGSGKDLQLTNFTIEVLNYIQASNENCSLQVIHMRLTANIGGEPETLELELPIDQLPNFNPVDIDARFYICPGKKTREYLIHYIQSLLADLPAEKMFLVDTLGDICIGGHHSYCTGNLLLGDVSAKQCYIHPNIRNFRVNYNSEIGKHNAFIVFLQFLDIEGGVTDIVGLHVVSGFMQGIFSDANIIANGTLLLVSRTQQGKTTLIEYATGFYSHISNTIRTDSSLTGIQDFLANFRTAPATLDDVLKSSDSATRHKVQTIMRQNADHTVRHTARTDSDITETRLSMTSEILPDNISDLGRTILVILQHRVNSEKLDYCLQRQDKLAAFYVQFIDWLYKNFERLRQSLLEDKAHFNYERTQTSVPYERLREHSFILKLALKYVLLYGTENNLISNNESDSIYKTIEDNIKKAEEIQIETMRYIAKKSGENALHPAKALYNCLKAKAICPGDKNSDCFIDTVNDVPFLWIRTEKLTYELNRIFSYHYSDKYYTKYFSEKGILAQEASGKGNTKRRNGRRYMVIRLDILELEVNSLESVIDSFL